METNEGQPKVGMGPCEELLRVCAAEIGITLESIEKSVYRDALLEMLEKVAIGKIHQATEANRRASVARAKMQAHSQMNMANQHL